MSKAYDYFKTLKKLSLINTEILKNILANNPINALKIEFLSLQDEIYNELVNEFIAPIERVDIFTLAKRLEEEFISICSFGLFKSQKNALAFNCKDEILALCNENNLIFDELKSFKNYKKLIKLTKENRLKAIKLINLFESTLEIDFKISNAIAKLLRVIYFIDTEIEKIVINNN